MDWIDWGTSTSLARCSGCSTGNIKNQLFCSMSGEYLRGTYDLASMVSACGTIGEIDLEFPDGGDAPAAHIEVRKEGAEGLRIQSFEIILT